MPRTKKLPPDNAPGKITRLASRGVKETDIAKALGVSYSVWKRWKTEDEDIKQAFEEARQIEEDALVSKVFEKAMNGDTTCLLFLLKCRHGWQEGNPEMRASAVQVNISLPGSMNPDDYEKQIKVSQDAD